jgi:hypothetical protein
MKHKPLILPLAAVALFIVSCDKDSDRQTDEAFDQHPTWTDDSTNNFWDKKPSVGFTIDTAWDGDTTINF